MWHSLSRQVPRQQAAKRCLSAGFVSPVKLTCNHYSALTSSSEESSHADATTLDASLSGAQPKSAIEQRLLKLISERTQVYRQVRPGPAFTQHSRTAQRPQQRPYPSSPSASNAHGYAQDDMLHQPRLILPSSGIMTNVRLKELDAIESCIAYISASDSLGTLRDRMHRFFKHCADVMKQEEERQAARPIASPPLPSETPLANISGSNSNDGDKKQPSASPSTYNEPKMPNSGWDQILETAIRSAVRLGDPMFAEALLEQTKRMGMMMFVRTVTERVYRALADTTWSVTGEAEEMARWFKEARQAGLTADSTTNRMLWQIEDTTSKVKVPRAYPVVDDEAAAADNSLHNQAVLRAPGFRRPIEHPRQVLSELLPQVRKLR